MRATLDEITLAESETTEMVEGSHTFPPESIDRTRFEESGTHTTCPWKGVASYYHVWADNGLVRDAAWYYPVPKPEAAKIASHVAFYANKVRIGE
ncbi:MAG: DUF427 domain-containing protein [Chloroflexia bacterium]|nr:DUF427 domain-containing protein [Chloroflexia bacterium]